MRICLYTATALPKLGGQEAVVDALARHFTLLGHRAIVLAPRPRLPLRPRDADLPYPVFRHPRFYSTRRLVSWYRPWLLWLYRREAFDVLHCHDVYPTGYLAALCRERIAAPLLITSHGGDVKEGNIRVSKRGMRPRYEQAVRSADALISIGRFTDDGFRALVPDPPRIETIPNGIDLAPFATVASRPADLDAGIREGEYLLFLGRLKRRKGVDTLLDAMSRLPAPPDAGVQLVVAGSGEEQSAIETQIARLGLRDRVRLVGRVDGPAKTYLLQNARATVMPSRVWEAFPLVLLESFAAGRPVIGTRIPGIEELIQNEETGLLVSPEPAEALASAITSLLRDRPRADALGRAAKRFAADYAWESIAQRHVALYDELIAARQPAAARH